jgi:hypothetical protein
MAESKSAALPLGYAPPWRLTAAARPFGPAEHNRRLVGNQ